VVAVAVVNQTTVADELLTRLAEEGLSQLVLRALLLGSLFEYVRFVERHCEQVS
jgi:hypothetical protein